MCIFNSLLQEHLVQNFQVNEFVVTRFHLTLMLYDLDLSRWWMSSQWSNSTWPRCFMTLTFTGSEWVHSEAVLLDLDAIWLVETEDGVGGGREVWATSGFHSEPPVICGKLCLMCLPFCTGTCWIFIVFQPYEIRDLCGKWQRSPVITQLSIFHM